MPFAPLKLSFAFWTVSLHLVPVFAFGLHLPATLRPFRRWVTTTATVAGFDSVSLSFVPLFALNEDEAKLAFEMTGGGGGGIALSKIAIASEPSPAT